MTKVKELNLQTLFLLVFTGFILLHIHENQSQIMYQNRWDSISMVMMDYSQNHSPHTYQPAVYNFDFCSNFRITYLLAKLCFSLNGNWILSGANLRPSLESIGHLLDLQLALGPISTKYRPDLVRNSEDFLRIYYTLLNIRFILN